MKKVVIKVTERDLNLIIMGLSQVDNSDPDDKNREDDALMLQENLDSIYIKEFCD